MKIFFSDLDGTLLYKHKKNLKPIDDNIHEIINLDIPFIIATGRSYKDSEFIASKYLNIESGYHICMNGGVIYKDSQVIFEKTLSKDISEKIYNFMNTTKLKFIFAVGFSKNEGRYNYKKSHSMNFLLNLRWLLRGELIKDVPFEKSLFEIDDYFYKYMFVASRKKLLKIKKEINFLFPELEVFFTGPISIEVCPKNVNKGEAIKHVCELENISLDEAAFIGDSGNDVSGFKVLKNSYCMSHANVSIKKEATYIVENVAEALRHQKKNNL